MAVACFTNSIKRPTTARKIVRPIDSPKRSAAGRVRKCDPMILMYHKVDLITPTMWWITPADLERQIATLAGKTFVYLEDYTSPEREVVLTFDDAYENVYHHALPILRAHNLPFELFVIGDQIGRL